MRLSFFLCTAILIIMGICAGVFALSGFDLLSAMMLSNASAVRSFMAICLAAALFELYYLVFFCRRR